MSTSTTAPMTGADFDEILRRVVAEQAPVFVEYDGAPQVVVLPIKEYERLQGRDLWAKAESAGVWTLIEEARAALHRRRGGRPLPPAEEIIREMREERDAQLLPHLHGR